MTADSYAQKVETVARALHKRNSITPWERATPPIKEGYREDARAALAALAIRPETPEQQWCRQWTEKQAAHTASIPLAIHPETADALGHTDLMVSPESIDAFMEANPLPPDDFAPAPAISGGEMVSVPREPKSFVWTPELAETFRAFGLRAADFRMDRLMQLYSSLIDAVLAAAGQKP